MKNGSFTKMIRNGGVGCLCALGVMIACAGCASLEGKGDLSKLGLEYHLQVQEQPRPNRIHVLRVDLAHGKTKPSVVVAEDPDGAGPAEAALTDPFQLAEGRGVVAFLNCNPWDSFPDESGRKDRSWFVGQPVDIQGLAVAEGEVRSEAGQSGAIVWFDEQGTLRLGTAGTGEGVKEGMEGFQAVLRKGVVVAEEGGPRHPRTAMGTDRTETVFWWVVVDGRQPGYSEGMTLHELGEVMSALGCWTATNMDGGGSSVMAMAGSDGVLHLVNSPSGRAADESVLIRPLPMILTLRRAE